jgi:GT2 family glycosyltransferase
MPRISVVIPNWNGERFLRVCLPALAAQTCRDFETIVVDNGSSDGSLRYLETLGPQARVIRNPDNLGFAAAANQGARAADGRFVALLNNDTEPEPDWLGRLVACIERDDGLFAVGSTLLVFDRPGVLEDAGNSYTALGFAYHRGEGLAEAEYRQDEDVFTVCAGAALYRKEPLLALGGFSEQFFAYVEDVDAGWRARRTGYRNRLCAAARVRHRGSATSGAKYNPFKVFLTNRNNVWLLRRNLPAWLLFPALPLLGLGFLIKTFFYGLRGRAVLGAHLRGTWEGLRVRPEQPGLTPGETSWRRDLAIWWSMVKMTGEWAAWKWRRILGI